MVLNNDKLDPGALNFYDSANLFIAFLPDSRKYMATCYECIQRVFESYNAWQRVHSRALYAGQFWLWRPSVAYTATGRQGKV